jgi:uncharacterized membrane protein
MLKRPTATPWIYRWSRPILAAIAGLGLATTTYLSVIKLTGNAAVCPIEGCTQVLNSIYAEIFGIPLSVFGAIAYLSMGIFAVLPLLLADLPKPQAQKLQDWTWLLLLMGGVAMTIFSSYLMYLLAFKIQLPCTYCIASALLSLSLLTVTILGQKWQDPGQTWFMGFVIASITLVITLGIFAQIEKSANLATDPSSNIISAPTTSPINGIGWEIITTSGNAETELAKHLTAIGAKEFIAWWCPHCHEQKSLFGKEAAALINKVECDPRGKDNPQPQLCVDTGIKGFPSWQIKGRLYSGIQTPEKLAQLSGYQGDRNFRYSLAPK